MSKLATLSSNSTIDMQPTNGKDSNTHKIIRVKSVTVKGLAYLVVSYTWDNEATRYKSL